MDARRFPDREASFLAAFRLAREEGAPNGRHASARTVPPSAVQIGDAVAFRPGLVHPRKMRESQVAMASALGASSMPGEPRLRNAVPSSKLTGQDNPRRDDLTIGIQEAPEIAGSTTYV